MSVVINFNRPHSIVVNQFKGIPFLEFNVSLLALQLNRCAILLVAVLAIVQYHVTVHCTYCIIMYNYSMSIMHGTNTIDPSSPYQSREAIQRLQ